MKDEEPAFFFNAVWPSAILIFDYRAKTINDILDTLAEHHFYPLEIIKDRDSVLFDDILRNYPPHAKNIQAVMLAVSYTKVFTS